MSQKAVIGSLRSHSSMFSGWWSRSRTSLVLTWSMGTEWCWIRLTRLSINDRQSLTRSDCAKISHVHVSACVVHICTCEIDRMLDKVQGVLSCMSHTPSPSLLRSYNCIIQQVMWLYILYGSKKPDWSSGVSCTHACSSAEEGELLISPSHSLIRHTVQHIPPWRG